MLLKLLSNKIYHFRLLFYVNLMLEIFIGMNKLYGRMRLFNLYLFNNFIPKFQILSIVKNLLHTVFHKKCNQLTNVI